MLFRSHCSEEFPEVIYVMGNHEYYHGDYKKIPQTIKECLSEYPNIHFLNNEHVEIGDVMFIGGTLWTDMNKGDEMTLHQISRLMNDFNIVVNSDRTTYFRNVDGDIANRTGKFQPEDAVAEHVAMLNVIHALISADRSMGIKKNVVVVGHHSPSKRSTKPQYESEYIMNGGYSSDLTDFI